MYTIWNMQFFPITANGESSWIFKSGQKLNFLDRIPNNTPNFRLRPKN